MNVVMRGKTLTFLDEVVRCRLWYNEKELTFQAPRYLTAKIKLKKFLTLLPTSINLWRHVPPGVTVQQLQMPVVLPLSVYAGSYHYFQRPKSLLCDRRCDRARWKYQWLFFRLW